MKITEFRKLIREEVRKVINEAGADLVKSLGYSDKKLKDYQVGKGRREGMPVTPDKLKSVLSSTAIKNINSLENGGVVFNKAYVSIRQQYNPDTESIMWSLIGTDSKGNEIIYDKYEGYTPGFGQTFIFVNGKKEKATEYLSSTSVGMPSQSNFEEFLKQISKAAGVTVRNLRGSSVSVNLSDQEGRSSFDEATLKGLTDIYDNLLKNKSKLTDYFTKHHLPDSQVVLKSVEYFGPKYYILNITSVKNPIDKAHGQSLVKSFKI